mmetsp:Transcript_19691/g.43965  ORF Transcript_19691/g.43965 Transcript_19691/m.43965 type:complete len:83 (+) Transcript_19691:1137-1385(+)
MRLVQSTFRMGGGALPCPPTWPKMGLGQMANDRYGSDGQRWVWVRWPIMGLGQIANDGFEDQMKGFGSDEAGLGQMRRVRVR